MIVSTGDELVPTPEAHEREPRRHQPAQEEEDRGDEERELHHHDAAGHLDRDPLAVMVVATGGSIYILSTEGAGTFSAGPALPIPTQSAVGSAQLMPVNAMAIGDVSADDTGMKDLVLVSKSNRLIAVMENTATVK